MRPFSRPDRFRGLLRLSVVFALTAAMGATAWACPLCKDNLDNAAGGGGLAQGFYYSILAMVAAPYAVVAAIGFGVYRASRRAGSEPLPSTSPKD